MLNPCHVVSFTQSYLLLTKSSKLNEQLFMVVIHLTFAPMMGLIFPTFGADPTALDVILFFTQHALASIVAPLTLGLSGRYSKSHYTNWKTFLFSWNIFVIYMRLVLGPLSMMTMINLNFTLCAATTDPWVKFIVGRWAYYFCSEFYLAIPGLSFGNFYLYWSNKLRTPVSIKAE